MSRKFAATLWAIGLAAASAQSPVRLEAPGVARRFDIAEFTLHVEAGNFRNPFLEADFSGEFRGPDGRSIHVPGFCDSADGRLFRLRFSPDRAPAAYRYQLRFRGGGIDQAFKGELRAEPSDLPGPVVADPDHPKHFRYLGSGEPFFHLGYTAYHLLDVSRSDADIERTIDYCARLGFNKIRFLLTGYARDSPQRTSHDPEHGVPDPWRAPNYGAPPGRVNPLPAWEGRPHAYDFTRFHLPHWRRAERTIERMRLRGMVATCIVTIEKQDLPGEYGAWTEHEYRLYRYAVARLAAFSNVWWDLGNEHVEYRNADWGNAIGSFLKGIDPYGRLRSAHGYAEFPYAAERWPSYIITQQYGDESKVYSWARRFDGVPMPYVNEEYGYEGSADRPGHGQNADWVRRIHWSIAMAGGYATYGDWSDGVSYFYTGDPGPGKAPPQLKLLREFFEALPFSRLRPCDDVTTAGFCLAAPPALYVIYLPRGGATELNLRGPAAQRLRARWFDPRTGRWSEAPAVKPGRNEVQAPDGGDWTLLLEAQ